MHVYRGSTKDDIETIRRTKLIDRSQGLKQIDYKIIMYSHVPPYEPEYIKTDIFLSAALSY